MPKECNQRPIVWLEDPTQYHFLRKGVFEYNKKVLTTKIAKHAIHNISKLIGYQLVSETNNYHCYNFIIYYIKEHDFKRGNLGPHDAVDPITLKSLR